MNEEELSFEMQLLKSNPNKELYMGANIHKANELVFQLQKKYPYAKVIKSKDSPACWVVLNEAAEENLLNRIEENNRLQEEENKKKDRKRRGR